MADTWTPISGYTPQDYTDTLVFEMSAETKKLEKIVGQALVAGEENSQYIKFVLPRYWDGIDISGKSFGIEYALAGTYYGTSEAVNAEMSTDQVRFGWIVPKNACAISGTLFFVLKVDDTDYVLKSQIADTPVFKTIDVGDVVPEPTKEQWYREFEARVEGAIDDAEAAIEAAQAAQASAEAAAQNAQTAEDNAEAAAAAAQIRYGSPLTAQTAEDMIDENRVYVYTGSEAGYTAGHWYYWDGEAWADGGVYNAVAIDTDTTLSVSGKAADAKATGDAVNELKSGLKYALDTENFLDSLQNGFIPGSGSNYPTTNQNYPNAKYVIINLAKGQILKLEGFANPYSNGRGRYIVNGVVTGQVSLVANDYIASTADLSSGFRNAVVTAKQDVQIALMSLDGMVPLGGIAFVAWIDKYRELTDETVETIENSGVQFYNTAPLTASTRNLANPVFLSERTVNGLTYSVDKTGKVRISGTATAQTDIPIYNHDVVSLSLDRYALSFHGDYITSGGITAYLYNGANYPISVYSGGDRFLYQTYEGPYKGVMLRVPSGRTVSVSAYVQFESGANVSDYIPHYTAADLELRQRLQNVYKFKMLNTKYIGDCCIFKSFDGKIIMIDTGNYDDNTAKAALTNAIASMEIKQINYLIISHFHKDHVSNVTLLNQNGLLKASTKVFLPSGFDAEKVSDLENDDVTATNYTNFMTIVNNIGCELIYPKDGDKVAVGDLVIEFFNCDHSDYYAAFGDGAVYNDCSLCNYVTIGDVVMMFTGDIEGTAMTALQKSLRKCNIFKVPHHCGRGNYIPLFMNSVFPEIALTSLGDGYTFNCDTEYNRSIFIANNTGLQKWFEDIGNVPNYVVGIMMTDIDMDISPHGYKFTNNVRRCIRTDEGLT